MKILFATAEAYPFIKTGGLGDIAYSLPKALNKKNMDVRVVLPKYSGINEELKSKAKHIGTKKIKLGWKEKHLGVEIIKYENIIYYLIDNEEYFKRDNIYGEFDDCERFTFFSKAVLSIFDIINFKPDVIHCNDWHTGIIPAFLYNEKENGNDLNIKTIYTIHNLKYQGVFSKENLENTLGLPDGKYYNEDSMKFYDAISFMKAGINYADHITTVSHNYSNEIKTKYFGEQLDGLFHKYENKLSGIVNGIDFDVFNPKKDKDIFQNYDLRSIGRKKDNKMHLQEELGLEINKDKMLIGIVGRLAPQKGIDLITHVLDEIISNDIQVVVLGTGDTEFENILREYSYKYSNQISVNIKFDEKFAKKIYASSDTFLMPSHFEPCGLSQLISMRYGTVPIVRETGGLKDTVEPYNKFTDSGTGFSFVNYNAHEMLHAIEKSLEIYSDKKRWNRLMARCMKKNSSWDISAIEYKKIYKKVIL